MVPVTLADKTGPARLLVERTSSEWVRQPRQARSEETLTRFLTATAELLGERERFDEVSVAEICRRAGRTVGSFYARFDDKPSVLRVVVEQVAEALRAEAADYWVPENFGPDSVEEIVGRTVDAVLSAYGDAGAVFHAAAIDAPHDVAFREARLAVWVACAEGFGSVLTHHRDKISHPDPHRAGELAMTALIATVDLRLIYGEKVRPLCADDEAFRADLIEVVTAIIDPGR